VIQGGADAVSQLQELANGGEIYVPMSSGDKRRQSPFRPPRAVALSHVVSVLLWLHTLPFDGLPIRLNARRFMTIDRQSHAARVVDYLISPDLRMT
jgi:hypothetical protein